MTTAKQWKQPTCPTIRNYESIEHLYAEYYVFIKMMLQKNTKLAPQNVSPTRAGIFICFNNYLQDDSLTLNKYLLNGYLITQQKTR